MSHKTTSMPQVVSQEAWRMAREALLDQEKELTRQRDAVNSARRRLPMVRVDKDYVFEGPSGKANLSDLFSGRRQLIVYHFMLDPNWEEGCRVCSFLVDDIGELSHLHARNTSLVLVSRAPLAKIEPFRQRMGWEVPWYSSFGSDFNYDFHVTLDDEAAQVEYNYRDKTALERSGLTYHLKGEQPGASVFLRDGGQVYHTYSTYGRGLELLMGAYNYLDLTPLGRQEEWEEPEGRSDSPAMAWVRHHDRYGDTDP